MEEKANSRINRLGGEKAKEIFTIRDTKNGTKLLCQEQREDVYVHVEALGPVSVRVLRLSSVIIMIPMRHSPIYFIHHTSFIVLVINLHNYIQHRLVNVDLHHSLYYPNNAHNVKNVELLKHIKIMEAAPTCVCCALRKRIRLRSAQHTRHAGHTMPP